jgi:uncharacterized membrane protein
MFPHHPALFPFALLGGIAWLAILAGVILLVIWAARAVSAGQMARSTAPAVEAPLDTLARRFAAGEISAEDFQRSRDLLRGEAPKS